MSSRQLDEHFNLMKNYYKRKLPHFIFDGYAYFITTRLANSLPHEVILRMKNNYELSLERIASIKNEVKKHDEYTKLKWKYFSDFDKTLDNFYDGSHWLRQEMIAKIVTESLHYRDGKDYDLVAYTIMSNHIHLVFIPYLKKLTGESSYKKKYPLGGLLASFKRYTAKECNKLLNRNGAFWQHENYDHVIRNGVELNKIVKYILDNPVKIGLVEKYGDYKWNYYNKKFL